MLRCGLNLTHDGGVAVTAGGRLLFAYEAEKLANSARHAPIDDLGVVNAILAQEGVAPEDIDLFVVNGWGADAVSNGVRVITDAGPVQVRPLRIVKPTTARPRCIDTGRLGISASVVTGVPTPASDTPKVTRRART